MNALILIVDDEVQLASHLALFLRHRGFQTALAHTAEQAREMMPKLFPDVVLMDLMLPDADGSALMAELKNDYPDSMYIIITAHGSIRSAVSSTRSGAIDYLTKPFEPDELVITIQKAIRERVLDEEVKRLRPGNLNSSKSPSLEYPSRAMRRVSALAARASEKDGMLLLLGESGTGKDRLALWIHQHSKRRQGPFFSINCAALSRELAESELFGHEPGAFTGTKGRKRGLLELAEGGTLLLNEVGELDAALQSKLLSFLDTRSFVRVGGEKNISVNARIVAATNRNLEQEVQAGRFRRDLFYRLNVLAISLPALNDRLEDIPLLAQELLRLLTEEMGLGRLPRIEDQALQALQNHRYTGNVRELRNIFERALMTGSGRVITLNSLNLAAQSGEWTLQVPFPQGRNLHEVKDEVLRSIIKEALRRAKTKQQAANLLGISRHALAYQMNALDIVE